MIGYRILKNAFTKSLILNNKSNGHETDPCGTPVEIGWILMTAIVVKQILLVYQLK